MKDFCLFFYGVVLCGGVVYDEDLERGERKCKFLLLLN